MAVRFEARGTRAAGFTLAAGLGLIGVGLWARRDVGQCLERKRVTAVPTPPGAAVTTASAARAPVEAMRESTLTATGGKTRESPEHALWIQSTALQTALVQAYLAQRLAELTVGLGALFVGIGGGLAAAARR
jgi:hypothetical protein